MKQKYKNMMEQLTLSPAAHAAIEAGIAEAAPGRKSPSRPLRRSLAAAVCLCLLLPITALGIEYFAKPVTIAEQKVNEEQAYYKVTAEVAQWPKEQFSAALQADLDAGNLQQTFRDKASLEQYLGLSLADSPTLEEAGLVENLAESFEYGFALRPQLALDPSARYILTASDWEGNTVTKDPEVLKISAHRVFQNTELYLDAWIILDSVTTQQLEDGIMGESFPPVTGHTMEMLYDESGNFLLDKNGVPQVEIKQFTSSDYDFVSTPYEMPNGNIATIITARFCEPDGRKGHYQYMGYFVQDGILYTVRPYAIYDPELDFPMTDKDGRKVLTAALDTFE